jgi:hypothetical protein
VVGSHQEATPHKRKRTEKERVEARDRRILEFPLSMSPNAVAKALKAARERPSTTSNNTLDGCGKRRNGKVPQFLVARNSSCV